MCVLRLGPAMPQGEEQAFTRPVVGFLESTNDMTNSFGTSQCMRSTPRQPLSASFRALNALLYSFALS
jgi:hypothetical protein